MNKLTYIGLYPVMGYIPGVGRNGYLYPGTPERMAIRAKWTGEQRPPRKGEWYLSGSSGSIVEAYQAPNDLSTPYHIAKLVRTETRTTVVELGELSTL